MAPIRPVDVRKVVVKGPASGGKSKGGRSAVNATPASRTTAPAPKAIFHSAGIVAPGERPSAKAKRAHGHGKARPRI